MSGKLTHYANSGKRIGGNKKGGACHEMFITLQKKPFLQETVLRIPETALFFAFFLFVIFTAFAATHEFWTTHSGLAAFVAGVTACGMTT